MDKARIRDASGDVHTFERVVSLERDEEEGEIRVRVQVANSEHATKYEHVEAGVIERVR
jgi:hypothetical protein